MHRKSSSFLSSELPELNETIVDPNGTPDSSIYTAEKDSIE
jgi:hypothetical protein